MTGARPVTDFFGTRLDPRALTAGLRAQGLTRFRLTLTAAGAVLSLAADEAGSEAAARAETWLRGELSPLTPLKAVPAASSRGLDGRFEDRRRGPWAAVALAEVPEGGDEAAAEAALRARLGDRIRVARWSRPGGATGVRPATILAASKDARALAWLEAASARSDAWVEPPCEVLLDGLEWGAARRPTLAAPAPADAPPVLADASRCADCGVCARLCPAACLGARGAFVPGGEERCLSCLDCVDACPQDALRPKYGPASATTSRSLARRPGWLSRLRGLPGPSLPAPFPPSFLLPRAEDAEARRVLGLSVATASEHAAVLVEDGAVAGAVEEERLSRVRHHGWADPARPGSTLASDPTLCLEEVLPRRAAGALLAPRGLTLDDVDLLAVNGLPARYRRAFSPLDASTPVPALRSGRVLFLPHHLCHAASAWRAAGLHDAFVLTADGRGDVETAAAFRVEGGRAREVARLLALDERSLGGVYETATRLLGFGPHGQGSLMALAALGTPAPDLAAWLSARGFDDATLRERGLAEAFVGLARAPGAPLERRHRDFAAAVQAALEEALLALAASAGLREGEPVLALAGGVALNCRANAVLRRTFRPGAVFVPPGANDAGTALGAALEGAARLGLPAPAPLTTAALGPAFTENEAEAALRHAGLEYGRPGSVAADAAELVAEGKVVAWVQGRAEFGPRALGARSLLADPRDPRLKERLNAVKGREPWRPFGASILAGREGEWFAEAFDSRFMLFAVPVRPEAAARIPAVVHADGTTRPQSVHAETDPEYAALLERFAALTGVPLALDTSFNRRGEPIACSPRDAVACFLGMPGVDALALGPFLARRPAPASVPARDADAALAALPGGRRLLLRLTARGGAACVHDTLADLAHLPDRSFDGAVRALAEGRRAACSELVVLRGEASEWPGLAALLRRARAMGYRFVQLQTDGRAFASAAVRRELLPLLDALELALWAAEPGLHDRLSGRRASFRAAALGARAASAAGVSVTLCVPVVRDNLAALAAVPALAQALGAARVLYSIARPVETAAGVRAAALARLADAAPALEAALGAADRAGVAASTEAVPFCALAPARRGGADAREDWRRFRTDDLDRLDESLDARRAGTRPEAPACRACAARRDCPKTWALYFALFGSAELSPLAPSSASSSRPSRTVSRSRSRAVGGGASS